MATSEDTHMAVDTSRSRTPAAVERSMMSAFLAALLAQGIYIGGGVLLVILIVLVVLLLMRRSV
jgi:hypothetical protein